MIKVLNIAQFIPIKGLQLDNDISLKIYSDLYNAYGIQSEFIKPVESVPKWQSYLKNSSKIRREIFSRTDYFNSKYNIKIHFYKGTSPIIDLIPFDTDFLLPLQFNCYNKFLINLIKTYGPHLIHAHSIHPDSYYAYELFKKTNIPYILTIRGSLSKVYYSKAGREILKYASTITTPSHALWSKMDDKYAVELLPHGIDDIWFNGKKKEFSSGILRLVTVSRLLKMKNIQIVLKAVARLINEGYKITYDIIGDGDYLASLINLTNDLNLNGFVRFHGFQNAEYMVNVYQNTDIFVMLSYPETFGRSYFEAAAQGLYIIGAKNTGAYGHLTESEAVFIDIDEFQLIETLKRIDSNEFYSKTSRIAAKINEFRNSKIIDKYYKIISGIVKSPE